MKKILILSSVLCLGLVSRLSAQNRNLATVTVSNPSAGLPASTLVEIPWASLNTGAADLDTARLVVLDAATGRQLPIQLETRGTGKILNLLVQVGLKPLEKRQLTVGYGKKQAFPTKTYGRFVPERKDDFAWENDKIAFRMYGKALESTPKENAYGMDVWVKRTDRMVLNERYARGEYHVDHGDGMDYYHVGYTLGAGNSAPFLNDSIWYSANYRRWEILDNGPLRTSFRLSYEPWNVAGQQVTATKTISLDAGSQMNRVEVAYQYGGGNDLPVVVGIIKRKEQGQIWCDEKEGLMAYWEPTNAADGTTGVGVVLGTPMEAQIKKGQILAIANGKKDQPFVYYNGAAWDRAGSITNSKQWLAYLSTFQAALKKPVIITLKKL